VGIGGLSDSEGDMLMTCCDVGDDGSLEISGGCVWELDVGMVL
jgi:hypothetical protein